MQDKQDKPLFKRQPADHRLAVDNKAVNPHSPGVAFLYLLIKIILIIIFGVFILSGLVLGMCLLG